MNNLSSGNESFEDATYANNGLDRSCEILIQIPLIKLSFNSLYWIFSEIMSKKNKTCKYLPLLFLLCLLNFELLTHIIVVLLRKS